MNSSQVNSSDITYYCTECNEGIIIKSNGNSRKICTICGNNLIEKKMNSETTPIVQNQHTINESLHSILELIGADLHQAILESMNLSAPTRQINMDYLQSLGKVQIDINKIILRDTFINIGPLQILAVPATFSWIPNDIYQLSNPLIIGNPILGNTMFINKEECKDSIIILERGEVSFANKSINAIHAGVLAIIIIQTNGMWPFIMTDNSNEIVNNKINVHNIPIVMISKSDGDLVKKIVLDNKLNNKQSLNNTLHGILKFGHNVTECSICQELFELNQIVYKLPCRHVYHVDCVTSWLNQSNTCPLCRLELPKAESHMIKKINNNNGTLHTNDLTSTYYN